MAGYQNGLNGQILVRFQIMKDVEFMKYAWLILKDFPLQFPDLLIRIKKESSKSVIRKILVEESFVSFVRQKARDIHTQKGKDYSS